MTAIRFAPIPTAAARAYRRGEPDAYGLAPERAVSDGQGNPCRHCLRNIAQGAGMLILAHRPFPSLQPYAETGPIFLCAEDCAPWQEDGLPPIFRKPEVRRLVKAYGRDDRIVYGLGRIVPAADVGEAASALFRDPRVAYVHVRSATNNCFICRIDSV